MRYASEVWGFHKGNAFEKIHLECFLNYVKSKKNTSSLIVYNKLTLTNMYSKKNSWVNVEVNYWKLRIV